MREAYLVAGRFRDSAVGFGPCPVQLELEFPVREFFSHGAGPSFGQASVAEGVQVDPVFGEPCFALGNQPVV